jgi:hypothetical protein
MTTLDHMVAVLRAKAQGEVDEDRLTEIAVKLFPHCSAEQIASAVAKIACPPAVSFPNRARNPFKASAHHNAEAGKIVASIVRPIVTSGGSLNDVLILTESVLVGVALACIRLGGDEIVLNQMFEGAKGRLAEIRLKDIKTEGRA